MPPDARAPRRPVWRRHDFFCCCAFKIGLGESALALPLALPGCSTSRGGFCLKNAELTQSSRTSSRRARARAHAELTHELTHELTNELTHELTHELTQSSRTSSRRAHGGETEFRAYVNGASDGRCRVVVLCALLPAPPFSRRSEGRPAKERKRVSRHGTCDERCQR